MDSTVPRWLYGSINPDIADIAMAVGTTPSLILACITTLFRNNQQARAGYLVQKFHNIKQGDKSVTAYDINALADVGDPVRDDALVWNTIKGLDNKYRDMGNLVPLLTLFPTLLSATCFFRNSSSILHPHPRPQPSTRPVQLWCSLAL
jgi:hypothetical protein